MNDLSRFEKLGMEVVGSKHHHTRDGCSLSLDNDTKKAYFSMSQVDAAIIFNESPYRVKFVLDVKHDRLYIVEVDDSVNNGITLSVSGKNDSRARCKISSLYEVLYKNKITGLKSRDIKYDKDLNAHYVEVR